MKKRGAKIKYKTKSMGIVANKLIINHMMNLPVDNPLFKERVTEIKLPISMAITRVMSGIATQHEINDLVELANVTEQMRMKFDPDNDEFVDICIQSRAALMQVSERADKIGRFDFLDCEKEAMNNLIALNDLYLTEATIKEYMQAILQVKQRLAAGGDDIYRMKTPDFCKVQP